MISEYLWVEKYRPQTINDCVLPSSIKKTFNDMVESGEVQNLLLSGGAGCGKTTIARALCNELETDHLLINCSEDGNIDTLRTKIRNFASTVSISGGKKVVILDEFDLEIDIIPVSSQLGYNVDILKYFITQIPEKISIPANR